MIVDRCELYRQLSNDLLGFYIEPEVVEVLYADALKNFSKNHPMPYQIELFDTLYQLRSINRKACTSEMNDDLISKAIKKLILIESEMESLNRDRPWLLQDWFQGAKHLIYQVLPPLELCGIGSDFRFGPGSTFGGGGPSGRHLLSKIGGTQTVTSTAFMVVKEMVEEYLPHWYESTLVNLPVKVVKGNRIAFVPKDATKVRQIAIEPSLNMGGQLAVGDYLSKRLRLFGVNLFSQEVNQRMAKEGSLNQSLATIDLSDASSRICLQLVVDLLPPDWSQLLVRLRSPYGLLPDGTYIKYSSFSTQGNGFTFPLESLIFWAISKACQTKRLSVFGDDIICDSSSATKVCAALESCGFVVNSEKSYVDGFFKESCGADYVYGVNVRPIFYKDECNDPSDVACLHNLLYRKYGYDRICQTLDYLRSTVVKPLYGPPALYSTNTSNRLSNILSYRWRDWFWKNGKPDDVLRGYFYSPRRIKVRSTNYSKYLCFLYGGNKTLNSSSLTKLTTRRISVRDRWVFPNQVKNSLFDYP